jgi:hypothetical protein
MGNSLKNELFIKVYYDMNNKVPAIKRKKQALSKKDKRTEVEVQ